MECIDGIVPPRTTAPPFRPYTNRTGVAGAGLTVVLWKKEVLASGTFPTSFGRWEGRSTH